MNVQTPMGKVATLHRMTIGKGFCPHGLKAKALLEGKEDWKKLFQEFHGIMEKEGVAPTPKCKSRAYLMEDYLLGDDEEIGCVHLTVSFLNHPGEPLSQEKIRAVGDTIKSAMVDFFGGIDKTSKGKVEFSLEMRIMLQEMYWRNID